MKDVYLNVTRTVRRQEDFAVIRFDNSPVDCPLVLRTGHPRECPGSHPGHVNDHGLLLLHVLRRWRGPLRRLFCRHPPGFN